ncbi:MAG: sulfur oxidation c-type cytochrome SoxA [Variibacter sp.]|nr:sulfur oxidation c-type cytochrome SoxA [Variibacter sp.]
MTGRAPVIAALLVALSALPAAGAEIPASERRSGFTFMSRETQAMQQDDSANPGMLWVGDGEVLWNVKAGRANRACADCHGDARQSMRGVAARYPAFDARAERPIDLVQRIDQCRQERQQAPSLRPEGKEALALAAFVANQSRGLPMAPPDDPRLEPFRANGRALYNTRIGQLNFSCANCHDDNWGKRLGGSIIPQAYGNGYPVYRLEWQTLGSLQRRLRNCMTGMRAEPFAYGAPEFVDLELYLATRARGLAMETPAVRP